MQLYEFYQKVAQSEKRLGQAAFDLLCEVRPDLAESIRSTDCDPYYAVDNQHANWHNFNTFLAANW